MLAAGHDVIMLTSRPKNEIKRVEETTIDNLKVIYIEVPYANTMGKLGRIASYLKFMVVSCVCSFKQKDIDLVFATSTPLTIGMPALLLKWFKRKKFVFEVRDLWPDFPVQMGAVPFKWLEKILYAFEKLIYKNAIHIIALSPGMQAGIERQKVSKSKITLIPNMSKPKEFFPHKKNEAVAKAFKINLTGFNIIHFGSMGLANGLGYIVQAAKYAQDNQLNEFHFIFLGSGYTEKELKEYCRTYNLNNVQFLGEHPMKIVREIVNLCDVSITSFLNLPVLRTNSPNKLFDSLSAGKPVIVNSAGWTKTMVEDNHCGIYVDPEDPSELIHKLDLLKNNPEELALMGRNARRLAEKKYDREILAQKLVDAIQLLNKTASRKTANRL